MGLDLIVLLVLALLLGSHPVTWVMLGCIIGNAVAHLASR